MTPLPQPLRGNELGTFTHDSVARRLPEIARRVVADNELADGALAAVESLVGEIGEGVIEPLSGIGPDQANWNGYVAQHQGESWLDSPWFFVEYYFYRRLLDAVDYWTTGLDPFRSQKRLGLSQALPAARQTIAAIDAAYAQGVTTDFLLIQLTDASLWGNQVDLSLWPAEDGGAPDQDARADRILVDERPAALRTLRERPPGRADVILDNVGSELVADLLLVDLVLRSDLADYVKLHAKTYPIFVSDATERDVAETTSHLAADSNPHLRNAGERLRSEFNTGRLEVATDPYWVSPLSWRDRPEHIDADLRRSRLVIVKGDANYRRLLGDRHWQPTLAFSEAIGPIPAPLLVLRTLKSEIAAGLHAESIAAASAADDKWMQNGRWAVANFAAV